MSTEQTMSRKSKTTLTLLVMVVLALVIRLFLAAKMPGYEYDTNTFMAWALKMAQSGPEGFYTQGYFADYPPGYMLILWLVGGVIRTFSLDFTAGAAKVVLCLVPILADLALGVFVWHLGKQALEEKGALLASAFVLFNPMFIYDSTVWKQVDSVLTLLLVLCFYALSKKMLPTAGIFYALALLVKPQALLFGPVFALCYLLPFLFAQKPQERRRVLGYTIAAFAFCMGILAAVSLLFQGEQKPFVWLWEKYTTTAGSYPYATINAFNLWGLLGANWVADETVFLFFSYRVWGMIGIIVSTAMLFVLGVKSYRRGTFSPWLLAGFYSAAIFTLAHNMHERYLVPSVFFLLAAFVTLRDKRLLFSAVAFSFTCLVNMAAVCGNVGGDEFLTGSSMQLLIRLCSGVEVAAFLYLAYCCWQLCVQDKRCLIEDFYYHPINVFTVGAKPVPKFLRAEAAFVAVLTLAVALVSFTGLGDRNVPQNSVKAQGLKSFTITFDAGFDATELFIYPGIGEGTVTVSAASGQLQAEVGVYTCWTWTSVKNTAEPVRIFAGQPVTVTLSDGVTLNEMALRDAVGNLHTPKIIADESMAPLFDEQQLVPALASYRNSMYFDEVYHGRTAYEFLHKLSVYETTHPPLGKDLIALGIMLFGMTPFGWRFAGTLFGVLMVPLLYLLGRELLKSRRWAGFAAVLFALDAMRFTQTRIATIDVFVVFFIMLASYFMLKATRIMVTQGVRKAMVPIAASGVAFGCACGSKWTGIYAGAGLAVLYFGALWARRKRLLDEKPDKATQLFKRDFIRAVAAGMVFFVAVPVLIYTLSYLPYFLRDSSFGLRQLLACQGDMFDYHSQLTATHPFQSAWFSWPFIWRPVWYYMGGGLAQGSYSSIAVLGNPVLWLGGLAAMLWLCAKAIRGRQGAEGGFLLLSYAAQLVPWMLVSRAVFIYHYFACVPFLALALGLWLSHLEKVKKKNLTPVLIGTIAVAAIFFVFFYPVMSGVTIGSGWASALKLLPSWGFYIV